MTFDNPVQLAPRLVGLVFVITGALKAATPQTFRQHLTGLRLFRPSDLGVVTSVVAGVEVAWGSALLVGLWPEATLPATAVLLVLLSGFTWWSVRTGKAEDCGCYGGFVRPSVAQSLTLNACFAALVLSPLFISRNSSPGPNRNFALPLTVGVVFGLAAFLAQRYEEKHGGPLIDLTPLKVGRRWSPKWSGGPLPNALGEQFVSFLGPECPFCRQWVRVLNTVHAEPNLPSVLGIVSSSEEELTAFIQTSGIRFPMRVIPNRMMGQLANMVPTTVLIESSHVREVWAGHASDLFFYRFGRAFFPGAM